MLSDFLSPFLQSKQNFTMMSLIPICCSTFFHFSNKRLQSNCCSNILNSFCKKKNVLGGTKLLPQAFRTSGVFVQQRTKSVKTKTKERKKERKEDKQQMVDDSNPQKFTFRDKKMKCLILFSFSFLFGGKFDLIRS